MQRIGIALNTSNSLIIPFKDTLECVRLAQARGFESAWITEGLGRDSISQIGALAFATEKIKLGTGIANVFSRSPFMIAMTMATIDEISNGRAILGLGVGHRHYAYYHGVEFEKPLQRMKEYIQIIKRVLEGETVTFKGEIFDFEDLKLGINHQDRIPIYVAALGPQMIRLAGEIGDGVLLIHNTVEYAREAIKNLEKGASRVGRDPSEVDIACYMMSCVSSDSSAAKNAAKKYLAFYASLPFYNRMFSQSGFSREATLIKQTWDRGQRKRAAEQVTDRMVETLTVSGTPRELRNKVKEYRSVGVDLPIIHPYPVGTDVKGGVEAAMYAV